MAPSPTPDRELYSPELQGFSGSGSTKFSVEIPVADSSGGAALALAQEVVAALPAALRTQFTIVDCSGSGSGNSGAAKVVTLAQCLADGRQLAGCLLVLGATRQQVRRGILPGYCAVHRLVRR